MVNRILSHFAIGAALALAACNVNTAPAGPEQRESRSVDLDKSDRVRRNSGCQSGNLQFWAAPGSC